MARASAVGELLVEGIGAVDPGPDEIDQQRLPRPSTAFSVHLSRLAIGLVRHALP